MYDLFNKSVSRSVHRSSAAAVCVLFDRVVQQRDMFGDSVTTITDRFGDRETIRRDAFGDEIITEQNAFGGGFTEVIRGPGFW